MLSEEGSGDAGSAVLKRKEKIAKEKREFEREEEDLNEQELID